MEKLKKVLPDFLAEAQSDPMFEVVTVDLKLINQEIQVEIDRDKALEMGSIGS